LPPCHQAVDAQALNQIEEKTIDSVVKQIVKAAEAEKPRFRFYAPWWQGFGVQFLRAFGK